MDFSLTPEQEQFQKQVRDFVQQHLTPELRDEVEREQYSIGPLGKKFVRLMGEQGWLGIGWPRQYGGQGRGAIEQWLFLQEMHLENLPTGGLTLSSAGPTLMRVGSEEQKREYLPKILTGEIEFAIGYTEPDAGSDLASLQTRATREGDSYVIKGRKIYTSAAHHSTHIWLLARTDPQAPKHRGISILIVPIDAPGVTIHPLRTMGSERTNEVFFEDVRIPAGNLVGEENQGWYYVAMALDFERLIPHARTQRQLENLIDYAKQTMVDGLPLSKHPQVRLALARLAVEVEVVRLFSLRSAWMIECEQTPNVEASILKVFISELSQHIAVAAQNIMGPYATLRAEDRLAAIGGRLEKLYRGFPMFKFAGGTNEVMRNIIAQRGLGMPRG
ncbi:MAG TPA: acyl-CoA dehydrogenase family protein [Candidatus Binataceae bacterium]|nr:acyl-CoA dehydrogenase family protein [Candidatus Binataceae bacterium]